MTPDEQSLRSSEIVSYYREQRNSFENVVRRAFFTCYGVSDLLVLGGRAKYRGILYTKLCVSARSLLRLVPNPDAPGFRTAHMDLSGAAALTRVIMDTFTILYHVGIERCSDEEFQARELLVFWRDQHVRKKIGDLIGWGDEKSSEKQAIERDLKQRLGANSYFANLPLKRQRDLLKKGDLLHPPEKILAAAGFSVDQVKSFYSYFSAHAHCDSVSFLFMPEQGRGRGYPSNADIALLGVCLEQARLFVSEGADHIEQIAPGAEARGRSIEDLDPLEGVAGPQWWFGKKPSELAPDSQDD